ncbi:MAG: LCP family protein [Acidimicrobiia bacterium]|jgi:LCP family protein required for cell wall assembly
MRNPIVRLLVIIPLTGLLLAGALTAAWLALGAPQPAHAATWFTVHRVESAASFTEAPDAPFYVLVLGNDGRTDADPGLGDAMHVIGVNPATGDASMIDVPRDTEAPSGGKINAFHATGGLPATVDQLDRMMGINISYAITTNFPGFVAMVNEIGGVNIEVTEPMFDHDSGTEFAPGTYTMLGDSLLAYSRDRKSYPAEGDRQRTVNQGKAIIAALSTLRGQNPGAAGTARLVSILARHVRTDNMDLTQMYDLGRLALSLDPARIKNVVVPTGASGNGTNLALTPAARDLFADFADDAILQSH